MAADNYLEQTGHAFVSPHNPGEYPPTLGTTQENPLGTDRLCKKQALFKWYTAVDREIKKQIITTVEPVFMYTIKDILKGFKKVTCMVMMAHLFRAYGKIDDINLKEDAVKMMGPYNPAEPPARLIEKMKKG